ncbi:MAG TPA: lytic transglycosylase domain-containing protein, partial [Gammaproteobacteria bacterium]|nr:lytic transglycosylase domain-containing protein [Gammaproteobacteria bacterium]
STSGRGGCKNPRNRKCCALLLTALACAAAAPAIAGSAKPTPELIAMVKRAVAASTSFQDRFAAQVWLMDMSARLKTIMPDTGRRLNFLRLVHAEATRADVPPELVLAMIQVESDFRRFAISSAGARGFMQVMPFWLDEIGQSKANLFEAQTNLRIGCTILRYYIEKANGDLRKALAAYNGNVNSYAYSDKVLAALSHRWYQQ